VTEDDSGERPGRRSRRRSQDHGWPAWPGREPRPDRAYAFAVIVLALVLLLAMFAVLAAVLYVMHAIARVL
jgi:hypothetical protein